MSERLYYSEYFYEKGSSDTAVLEKNVKEHPYSSLAAFLLLYHYKKIAHEDFDKLARKTALLFNNSHWLQFQLSEKSFPSANEDSNGQQHTNEENELPGEVENEPVVENSFTENLLQENSAEVIEHHDSHFQSDEVVEEIIPENLHEQNEQPEVIAKENIEELTTNTSLQQEFNKTETVVNENELNVFEPLHTVDYFASQGIKINEELLKNDKLGSQMKSFTAWLRSMKKLHPAKLEEQSLATEKIIQTAADESNINTEVLTEAMAEVLIKQDKKDKAIEMFSKLSLINPSKSAYFAARIESIKSN